MTPGDEDRRIRQAEHWWSTAIVDIHPGEIAFRGYPIEQLIGRVGFAPMVWLMLRGELPPPGRAALLEAAMVAAVDHGPHAPSIAISRMAVTCGLPLNGAMASAINVLDDIHGGAGEQCMALMQAIAKRLADGGVLREAVRHELARFSEAQGPIIPGFGHRFHPVDPRAGRLLGLVEQARQRGEVAGRFPAIARAIEAELAQAKGKPIPMNIDAATAVVFCELGFAPPLGRGLFILSRAVGILAHAWEQQQQGGRIKGPMPPTIPYRYTGPPRRDLPSDDAAGAEPPAA
jgi:citrate synthase